MARLCIELELVVVDVRNHVSQLLDREELLANRWLLLVLLLDRDLLRTWLNLERTSSSRFTSVSIRRASGALVLLLEVAVHDLLGKFGSVPFVGGVVSELLEVAHTDIIRYR